MGYALRVVVIVLTLGSSLAGASVSVSEPETYPVVLLLRAVREDKATPEQIRSAVTGCLEEGVPAQRKCLSAAHTVMLQLARVSDEQRASIVRTLQELQMEGPKLDGGPIGVLLQSLTDSDVRSAEATLSHRWTPGVEYASLAKNEPPPKKEEIGNVRQDVLDARLFVYLKGLLYSQPEAVVARAFEVASAESCEGLLDGQADWVCHEMGLWNVQRMCLSVAFDPLYASTGEPKDLAPYMRIDPKLARIELHERIWTSDDHALRAYGTLMERWRGHSPTRWQAWADVIEVLRPQFD